MEFLNISNPLLDYALRVVVCSAILWLVCMTIVRYINFRLARVIIIASVVVSIVLPMFRIGIFDAEVKEAIIIESGVEYYQGGEFVLEDYEQKGEDWFTLERLVIMVYGVVMFVLIARMTVGLIGITRYRRGALRCEYKGVRVVVNPMIGNPFSFCRTVYMGDMEDVKEREMVMVHESAHVREHHSAEVIIMEVLGILMWFNPFVYLLKRLLREVHEYQADSAVVGAGYDVEKYKLLIFSQLTGHIPDLAGALTHSLTKKRLIMITQKISNNSLRALLLLPALMVCAALVSFTRKEAAPAVVLQKEAVAEVKTELIASDDKIITEFDNNVVKTATVAVRDTAKVKKVTLKLNNTSEKGSETVISVTKDGAKTKVIKTAGQLVQIHYSDSVSENTAPTYIVNGVVVKGQDVISMISPDKIKSIEVTKSNGISIVSIQADLPKDADGKDVIVSQVQTNGEDSDKPLLMAEVMPTFRGENAVTAFAKWCMENIKYPQIAIDNKVSGRVIFGVVVNKEGKISDAKILRSSFTIDNSDLTEQQRKDIINKVTNEVNEQVLNTIKSAPDEWTPAKQNGKPVNLMINVPLNFK